MNNEYEWLVNYWSTVDSGITLVSVIRWAVS